MEASTSQKTKRSREVLTIEKKLEIIKDLKKGVSSSNLSRTFNVPRTTINDIKKNAEKIEKFVSEMESLQSRSKKRKTMRKATNEQLDRALYLWFIQKRAEGIPLSGPILQERALFFNRKLNVDNEFKASSGWLHNFKNRHGIRELNIEGEKLSATSIETIDKFKSDFEKMISDEGLTRHQVFNADETGLNFKALPTKTLASCSEKYAPGYKMQKQRVTIMVCANASGECQLPLVLIGKAKKPRCLKNCNMNALPVNYFAQKNSWMDQSIFLRWFRNAFVPHVRRFLKSKNLPPKAVLLLDNAPSHPEKDDLVSDDGEISCYYLPANSTSVLQPMDQSVIESLKRRYRKKFLQSLVSEEETSLLDFWKRYNLKNVIDNITDCWAELPTITLQRCWSKLWPDSETTTFDDEFRNEIRGLSEDVRNVATNTFNLNDEEIYDWLNCDQADIGYQLLTDEDIIDEVMAVEEIADEDENECDDFDQNAPEPITTKNLAREAVSNISKYIEWYEQQDEAQCTEAMLLRRFRAFAQKKSEKTVKQSLVTEYFEKK